MYLPNEKYTHPGKGTATGKGPIATASPVADPSPGYSQVANAPGALSSYGKQKMGMGRDKSPLNQALDEAPTNRGRFYSPNPNASGYGESEPSPTFYGGNPLYGRGNRGTSTPFVNLGRLDYGPWSGGGTYYNPYTGEALGGKENRFGGNSAYSLLNSLGGQQESTPQAPASITPEQSPMTQADFMSQWRAAGSPKTFTGDLMEALNQARSNRFWER